MGITTLTDVSETALLTLRARAVEAERADPVLHDPAAGRLFDDLTARLEPEVGRRITRRIHSPAFTRYVALRARYFDGCVREFRHRFSDALVVSLGCGFDTRYFRISDEPWRYIEIDLPEVVALKRAALGEGAAWPMVGCSVLEAGWREAIAAVQTAHVLFLAEGLLMYLPRPAVAGLFNHLAARFSRSVFLFEVAHARYTRGFWKAALAFKMAFELGAAAPFLFGVREAEEVTAFGPDIRIAAEWSCLDDLRLPPELARLWPRERLRKTIWTVTATLGW